MRSRVEMVLPAVVTFVLGLGTGLVVGHLWGRGGQVRPEERAPGGQGPGMGQEAGADQPGGPSAQDLADERAQLERLLEVHEAQLASAPADVQLIRTVGNYLSLLGRHEQALARYSEAEKLARESSSATDLAQVLVDQGVAHAELGDVPKALAVLEEAAGLDATDVRSRLAQLYLYLTQVMPSPPPGMDRRQAADRAEALIAEVLELDPDNPDALHFKQLIDSVRASRPQAPAGRPAAGGPPPSP